jgi:hypothetical protein
MVDKNDSKCVVDADFLWDSTEQLQCQDLN